MGMYYRTAGSDKWHHISEAGKTEYNREVYVVSMTRMCDGCGRVVGTATSLSYINMTALYQDVVNRARQGGEIDLCTDCWTAMQPPIHALYGHDVNINWNMDPTAL